MIPNQLDQNYFTKLQARLSGQPTPATPESKAASTMSIAPEGSVGTPEMAANAAKSIAQGITRNTGSVGVSLAGGDSLRSEDLPENLRGIKDFIFGKEPVESVGNRIVDLKTKYGIPEGLAAPLVAGSIALDFSGLGGRAKTLKYLAELKSPKIIETMLAEMGATSEVAPLLAKEISTMDNVKDVSNALRKVDRLNEILSGNEKAVRVGEGVQGSLDTYRDDVIGMIHNALKTEKDVVKRGELLYNLDKIESGTDTIEDVVNVKKLITGELDQTDNIKDRVKRLSTEILNKKGQTQK